MGHRLQDALKRGAGRGSRSEAKTKAGSLHHYFKPVVALHFLMPLQVPLAHPWVERARIQERALYGACRAPYTPHHRNSSLRQPAWRHYRQSFTGEPLWPVTHPFFDSFLRQSPDG